MADVYREPRCAAATLRRRQTRAGGPARPGMSNHVWGLAVDLCGGAEPFDTPQHAWLPENADEAGWINPSRVRRSGSNPEPWHWEFSTFHDPGGVTTFADR
ncbi:MAG: M15 family metallopeptidase [Nocardioides sp.]